MGIQLGVHRFEHENLLTEKSFDIRLENIRQKSLFASNSKSASRTRLRRLGEGKRPRRRLRERGQNTEPHLL